MASSSASMVASKLRNLQKSALHQNLMRRHLLHPSAVNTSRHVQPTPTLTDAQLENGCPDSPNRSLEARILNLQGSNFQLNLPWLSGPAVTRIEAARTYVPSSTKDDAYEDFDDDYDDDDDGDIEHYSGSEFDDDDDDDDVDEDPDTRPSSRRYKN